MELYQPRLNLCSYHSHQHGYNRPMYNQYQSEYYRYQYQHGYNHPEPHCIPGKMGPYRCDICKEKVLLKMVGIIIIINAVILAMYVIGEYDLKLTNDEIVSLIRYFALILLGKATNSLDQDEDAFLDSILNSIE